MKYYAKKQCYNLSKFQPAFSCEYIVGFDRALFALRLVGGNPPTGWFDSGEDFNIAVCRTLLLCHQGWKHV